jgi:hypothetical protein
MKKIIFLVSIFILGTFSGYTQGHSTRPNSPQISAQNSMSKPFNTEPQIEVGYSKKNLAGSSLQDLNIQLIKAKNLKNTGTVLLILGPAVSIAGIAVAYRNLDSGAFLFAAGFVTTVVGIPIALTGSSRVVNIEDAIILKDRDSLVNIEYYNDSKTLRGVGHFLTVTGPVILATALILDVNNNSASNPMYIAGAIATCVGIPLYIAGSKRVNKVVQGCATPDAASLNIAPGFVYNNKTQNLYPGVTLRMRF